MSPSEAPRPLWFEHITGLNQTMLTTALLVMLTSAGFSIILPFLPLYAESLGASSFEIGCMVAAYAVGSALTSILGGWLADRAGRKVSILVGLLIFSLATLLLGTVQTPILFILFRFIEGAGFGFIYPAANALAQDLAPPERLGQALGTYSTITLMGSFIGPAIGGFLSASFGYTSTFLVIAGVTLVTAVLASVLIREPTVSRDSTSTTQPRGKPTKFFLTPTLVIAYLGASAVFFNNGFMQIVEVLYFSTVLGASLTTIGIVFTGVALATAVARIPAGWLIDHRGVKVVLVYGLALSGVFSALIVAMPNFWLAAISSAVGAFFGVMAFAAVPVIITREVPRAQRGRANGVLSILSSVGLIIGSPIGALLFGAYTPAPFLTTGVLFLIVSAVIALSFQQVTKPVVSNEVAQQGL